MKKTRKNFFVAMQKAGWRRIEAKDGKTFDRWRYRTNGAVIWDNPAWLNWDGGEITEIPF